MPERDRLTHQNGVTRPGAGTITGRVWDLADELHQTMGRPPSRSEVMARGTAAGINENTVHTQYGQWRKFHGLRGSRPTLSMPASVAPAEARVLKRLANQVVGNAGLYYVCYRLSLAGWNAMPTARNAKGIDILAYSQAGDQFRTIQVKALSKRNPVPLGSMLPTFIAEHIVICQRVLEEPPRCFILSGEDIRQRAHRGLKDGQESYWLQPKAYEAFRDRWDRIGSG